MKIDTQFDRKSQALSIRFEATLYETRPFVDQLWFWGVSRAPDQRIAALAACIVASRLAVETVELSGLRAAATFYRTVSHTLSLDVHGEALAHEERDLLGGDNTIYPYRYAAGPTWQDPGIYHEPLSWTGIEDFRGKIGGKVHSNIDMFPLSAPEKDLVVALFCAGATIGSVVAPDLDPTLGRLLHVLGLGVIANVLTG